MKLNLPLIVAFLFAMGAIIGWGIEVIYRRFFSKKNPERRWLNPGFCLGPYLPLYGFGLVFMFLLSYIGDMFSYGNTIGSKLVLFAIMAIVMTIIELIAGLLCVNVFKIRLWDYSNQWANFKGIICPKFTLFWALLSALYYFLVQPNILESLDWLSKHLTFSFFVGLFYGVFVIDLIISSGAAIKMRQHAKENNIVIDSVHASKREHIASMRGAFFNFLFNSRVGNKDREKNMEELKSGK